MPYKIMSIVTRKLEGVNHFHYYLCRQLKGGGMEITMNSDIIISVLIPMYNASLTIKRCLDSLCFQYPKMFEIVIVDDGSDDSSYEIAKEYADYYDNIRIYKQCNQGVAKTRQHLVDYAFGKYVMFCDADDYFEKDALHRVYDIIANTSNKNLNIGAYIFGYNLIRKNGRKTVRRKFLTNGIYEKKEYAHFHVKGISDLYWSALWNKCYRKDMCCNLKICFEELMEDVMFNIDYLSECEDIYISDVIIYNYVQVGESLTRSPKCDNNKTIVAALKTYKKLQKKLEKGYPGERKAMMDCMYSYYRSLYCRSKKIDNKNVFRLVYRGYYEVKFALGWKWIYIELKTFIRQIYNKVKNR